MRYASNVYAPKMCGMRDARELELQMCYAPYSNLQMSYTPNLDLETCYAPNPKMCYRQK